MNKKWLSCDWKTVRAWAGTGSGSPCRFSREVGWRLFVVVFSGLGEYSPAVDGWGGIVCLAPVGSLSAPV